jgi:hypothetical protein
MNNFEKISVVGNGLSAWMMCAFMAKQLANTNTKITMYVGVKAEPVVGLQSPLPLFNDFLRAIDISAADLKEAGFNPKLGTAYLFDNKNPFFHIWGQYGAPIGPIEFHQVLQRYKQLGQNVDINRLSIGAASVLANRFQQPTANPLSIFSTYESSFSFETEAFLNLLKKIVIDCGVEISEEQVVALSVGEHCYVRSESDIPQICDYLINTVPGLIDEDESTTSWFVDLPVELASTVNQRNVLSSLVNKVKVLDESAWLCEITHGGRAILNQYRLSSRDSDDIYVHRKPRACRYLNFGPAMAKMYSPLFSSIDLDLIAFKFLLQYFPTPMDSDSVVNQYNRAIISAFENLRDITQLCLHELLANKNLDDDRVPLSDQAIYKARLFRARGRYPLFENEFFKRDWQIWLLLGLGFECEDVEPMVSSIDIDVIKEHVNKIENSVMKALPLIPLAD